MQRKFSQLTAILVFGLVNIMALSTTVKAQDSEVHCRNVIANAKNRGSCGTFMVETQITKI